MSEQNETDDKITVLFPDREADSGDEVSDETRQEVSDEAPEEPGADGSGDDSDPPVVGDGDGTGGEPSSSGRDGDPKSASDDNDNVVRLDFDGGAGVSSEEAAEDSRSATGDRRMTSKFEVFDDMIADGMVMVTLDTRTDGVEVPPKFQGLPELRLNFSHMFHIDDFDYDTDGVRASLSFDGTRHFCNVPWEAVFMLYSHESGDVIVFDPVSPPGSE